MLLETLFTLFVTTLVFWLILYVVSIVIHDASIADVGWGLSPAISALVLYVTFSPSNIVVSLVYLAVILWGIRLAIHIGSRKIGKPEDWRYKSWREQWSPNFVKVSFYRIFMLQASLSFVMALPLAVVTLAEAPLSIIFIIGLLIWAFGFIFEIISDLQLRRFLKFRADKSQIMTSGLWKYSRHPNYFGEVLSWWGIGIAVISLPYGWLAIASPLLITYLILFVSGIPLLEQKYRNRADYNKYAERTSSFFPLPPKRSQT